MPDIYAENMRQILMLLRFAATLDIDVDLVRTRHSTAEAVGPLLHPSEWMQGGAKNLEDQGEVLDVAIPFICAAREIVKKHVDAHAALSGAARV